VILFTAHDLMFKWVFGNPEHARGVLRSLVPSTLSEALDWSSLTPSPGNLISGASRQFYTDLIFSAAWSVGRRAPVYFLFEHQSSSDRRMALRLLSYMTQIWERWSREHAGEAGAKRKLLSSTSTLPLIVPIVLYHGEDRWSAPPLFSCAIDVDEGVRDAVRPFLVDFGYLLDDLSRVSGEALRKRTMSALATLTTVCFKYAASYTDPILMLRDWVDLLRAVFRGPDGPDSLERVVRYILTVNGTADQSALEAFVIREVGPEAKDIVMTAGQRLIEQGIQQGLQQGEQQGERKVLLRLLRKRFGKEVDREIEQRLAAGSVDQLDVWTDRVLSAATLGELFAD
jgi:hypothetical protein